MHYAPATPLRERLRSYCADDVVGAVHIRIEVPPIRRPVQATLHPPATEHWDVCRAVKREHVRVQETGLAGGALLGDRTRMPTNSAL